MSIFSKIKKVGQKVATGVYNTVNSIGSAISKASKQPAAVGMAFPTTSAALQSAQAANTAKVNKDVGTYFSQTIVPLQGGDISKAQATGQYGASAAPAPAPTTPTNIYSASARGGNSATSTNSLATFGAVSAPSTITSSILSGGGSSGSINLPSGGGNLVGGAIGALAGIKAGAKSAMNADGTPVQYDEKTGLPIAPKADKTSDFFDKYLADLEKDKPQSLEEQFANAESKSGVVEQRQLVNNYQSQLNAITAQAEADQLSVTGQGRGIPEPIILGQQNQIAKEAAIRALPIAAQLSAAQGNLALAEQHLETRFNLLKQDAQNMREHNQQVRKAVYDYATTSEKRTLEKQDKEDDRMYKEHQNFLDTQNKLLLSAVTQKAPGAIINAITNAKTAQEAITAAGAYGRIIPKPSAGGTTTQPMSVLDVARYNELYPNAGVTAGDTEAQANAKVQASNSPEAKTRNLVVAAQTAGNSYETVIAEINKDTTIKDKATALAIAKEVYAVGETAVSPIETEIARLKAGGILTNADIRSTLLKKYGQQAVNNSSVGSMLDKIGSFLFGGK